MLDVQVFLHQEDWVDKHGLYLTHLLLELPQTVVADHNFQDS